MPPMWSSCACVITTTSRRLMERDHRLWSRSIKRLDVVVMTHAHEDHMGGMVAVLKNFHPREIWIGAAGESPEWQLIRSTASELHIPIRALHQSAPFPY